MSEKKNKIEEILSELTLEDVLLMVEIDSAYIEKLMRARAKLQRIYTLLGLSKSVSERELLYSIIESTCLLYTSPSPRDGLLSRMPSSA